jgi:phosphoglucomutase
MRHDYEGLDTEVADALIDALRNKLPALKGSVFGALKLAHCDDFSYLDPVDGSVSEHQGIRIVFADGARIVYRLSGTGTEGATLRVYLERYEPDPSRHDRDVREELQDLASIAGQIAGIVERTGRQSPSVVT